MYFFECEFLKIIPDVSKIPNLEKLTLDYCTSLVEIHDSVGSHDKLVLLSLKDCYNLRRFPTSFKLRSLEDLNLDGCSRINHFPEIECEMKSLNSIDFSRTGIKELPSSIRYLIGLEQLYLEGCINLTNLPSNIDQLQDLYVLVLNGCSKLVKFPEKMGDNGQSMLPPTNSSVSNDDCSSIEFPALKYLFLENCPLLESDFFRIFNCSPVLQELRLSGSNNCYPRLNNCKQLIEPGLPKQCRMNGPNSCISLDLRNTCRLTELPALMEHLERRGVYVSGNKIPDWFSYRKEVSNSSSCEIDIDVPADLDGEITAIAFSAVIETEYYVSMKVKVISGGREIYDHFGSCLRSELWLHFLVLASYERYDGHLRVTFCCYGRRVIKSVGFHLVRRCEEKINSIDGIQVTKRPRDDDGNLESNWLPQQKRHSSTLGVRISDAGEF